MPRNPNPTPEAVYTLYSNKAFCFGLRAGRKKFLISVQEASGNGTREGRLQREHEG